MLGFAVRAAKFGEQLERLRIRNDGSGFVAVYRSVGNFQRIATMVGV